MWEVVELRAVWTLIPARVRCAAAGADPPQLHCPPTRRQAGRELVQLHARVTQTGDGHERVAHPEECSGRQAEQIEATGRDVLAHLARTHIEAPGTELVVELAMDQMDLAEVRL